MSVDKKYYSIETPIELLKFINENLTPKIKEKKEHGEVFTPIYIVEEMLEKLPEEVWNNRHLKWLDPAVGIGNFPIIAFIKLMEGLKREIPDEEERRKWILENMLYMIDISKKSISILNKVFCAHKYKLNIFEESFVKSKNYAEYNFDIKFDIIMGNPPYNEGGVGKGGGVFWTKFVNKSIKILNNEGYLCYIHPLGWRKPIGNKVSAGNLWDYFRKNGYLKYLHISDEKIKYFPKVDYYIYHNSKKIQKTLIYNKYKNNKTLDTLEINHLRFIPNFINIDVLSIMDKIFNVKYSTNYFNIIYNQSFKPNNSHTNISGIPHAWIPTLKKEYKVAFKTYDIVPEYINQPKIILTHISGSSKLQGKLFAKYYESNIGTTNNSMYVLENKKYENYFNSNLITFLMKITQYTDGQYGNNQFKILNLIKKPEGLQNNPTDLDIYNYYEITKEEQNLIEKIID